MAKIDLTDSSIPYPIQFKSSGTNVSGDYINEIIKRISQTGIDTSKYGNSGKVNINFDKIVKAYQKANNLKVNGTVTKDLIDHIMNKVKIEHPDQIEESDLLPQERADSSDSYYNSSEDEEDVEDKIYDPHYEPFFLNESSKQPRRNRKDIIISLGNGAVIKRIKDVYMRSVATNFDTSGKPITEAYTFIARDIKESDASEDDNIYLGDEKTLQASSDIKYDFDNLFKDR
jgi:hypothetical protein